MEGATNTHAEGAPSVAGLPLLARHRELQAILAALDEARRGRGRLVSVVGEPGIGKTRLLDHVADLARADGVATLWGRSWEAGGAPAFWPWTQVVRRIMQGREADWLRDALGPAAPYVAQLAPEQFPEGRSAPPAGDAEHARFALFDGVATLLRTACAGGPMVVLLEDLHAADLASLRLLEFVARAVGDIPVLILTSHRGLEVRRRDEAAEVLARIADVGLQLELGGLDTPDLGRLVAQRTGAQVPDTLVRALHEATDGNPFYADEIVRLLQQEGTLGEVAAGADALPLPTSLRAAIRRRLAALAPGSTDALSRAAVIGREFRLRTLERMEGQERGALLAALDASIEAGIVVTDRHEVGRYRFAHALFRETLYEDLPDGERRRLHGEVARALEELYGDAIDRSLAELAHHYLEADQDVGLEQGIAYSVRAGRRALAVLAHEEAVEHFTRALGALGMLPPDDHRRGELLLALGAAQMRAGATEQARASILEAADLARMTGAHDLLAQAAMSLGVWGMSPRTDDVLVALLREALEHVRADDPASSALRARLLARLGSALAWTQESAYRAEVAAEALALARAGADDITLGFVLVHAHIGRWGPDTLDERAAAAEELRALAERTEQLEWVLNAYLFSIPVRIERGEGAALDREIADLEALVGRLHQPRVAWLVPCHRALRASMEGRWEEFEALSAEAREMGSLVHGTVSELTYAAQLLTTRWQQGRTAELEAMIRAADSPHPGLPVWRCSQALAYAETARDARAWSMLELLAADDFRILQHDNTWLVALAMLADVCQRLGAGEHAATLYALLEPYGGRHVCTAQGTYCGPVHRYLGLLATARGATEDAVRHYAAARVEAQRINAPPQLAHIALGEAFAHRGGGDAEQARVMFSRAQGIAEELAIPALAARAAAAAEELAPAAAAPAPADPGAPGGAGDAVLRREGGIWTFHFEGRVIRVASSKGLGHLATLLDNPGVEIHALDLVGGGGTGGANAGTVAAGREEELQVGADDAGPLLDAQAKAAYRERVEELRAELAEAESFHDVERAARLREELEFVAQELSAAVGLGGRDRRAASNSERARVNVTRAIRGIIRRIAELDPALGHELDATIRTGTFCVHEPDPRRPVAWQVERG